MWKPCVQISAFVAVPWGTAAKCARFLHSHISNCLHYPGLGRAGPSILPRAPSELFEVCFPSGACQPLSLKQFTKQSVNSQLRGTLDKVLHLLWHLLLLFHCFLKHEEGSSHKREQICYLVLPPFMCLQSRQRKHLLMSGRQTLTR